MNTTITLYQYNGERNRMTKTLKNGTNVIIDFNSEYNIITPTIKLCGYETLDYNYCYIPDKKKYYFIDRIIERRNGFFECYLTEDVLQTYHDEILELYGNVSQTQKFNDSYESNVPVVCKPTTKVYSFNNDAFDFDGTNYVLIGTGYKTNG